MPNIRSFTFNYLEEKTYLVWDESLEAVLIDPGCYRPSEAPELSRFIEENKLKLKAIWLTHGHFDHICGVASFPGVPVYMHPADKPVLAISGDMATGLRLRAPDTSFSTVTFQTATSCA